MPGRWIEAGRAQRFSAKAGQEAMPVNAANRRSRTRRGGFATPRCRYLDDAYTLARYLLRDATDAEDAVQECYLRALKHFDSYRGPAMKPWLFAILRNVCRAEFARRASSPTGPIDDAARQRRADAAVARSAGNAGDPDAAAAGRRHDPAARDRAGRTVPGDLRAARNPQSFVSRDRRCRRGAGRHRDVPPRARPRHAALGMDGGRGANRNDLRRG